MKWHLTNGRLFFIIVLFTFSKQHVLPLLNYKLEFICLKTVAVVVTFKFCYNTVQWDRSKLLIVFAEFPVNLTPTFTSLGYFLFSFLCFSWMIELMEIISGRSVGQYCCYCHHSAASLDSAVRLCSPPFNSEYSQVCWTERGFVRKRGKSRPAICAIVPIWKVSRKLFLPPILW